MSRSYALFSSGAGFGRAVLDELLRLQLPPRWVVLPQFPPLNPLPGDSRLNLDRPPRASDWPCNRLAVERLYAPRNRQTECARQLESRCDFLLVACWPWLISPRLINSVSCAALNLHPSLLPKYRGPDPLGEQIDAGDSNIGVTLHLLGASFDGGDIVAQRRVSITEGGSQKVMVEAECAKQGARLFATALADYPHWQPWTQPV